MIIGTNFKLSSKKYLDNRQQCASLNDLIINKDSILYPQGFEVYCIKEKAWYQNVSEGDTPEWKIRQSGTSEGGTSIDDTKISATTTWSSEYIYDMKLELQDLITQTEDYVAEIDDRLLYVEGRLTSIGSFDGSYDSLTNKPEFPSLQGYATHEYVDKVIANIGKIEGTKDYNELINQPINNVAIEYMIDERLIVNVGYFEVGKWYIVNTDLNEEYNSATSFSLVYYLNSDSYSIINTFENEDMHSFIYVSSINEKEIKIKYTTIDGKTYELIYNKETNEKTLNLLTSSGGNGSGGFSGDYNDLTNRPCYDDRFSNIITSFEAEDISELLHATHTSTFFITEEKIYPKISRDKSYKIILNGEDITDSVQIIYYNREELIGWEVEEENISAYPEDYCIFTFKFNDTSFEIMPNTDSIETSYGNPTGVYSETKSSLVIITDLPLDPNRSLDFEGLVEIYEVGGELKQLDEKFIPNKLIDYNDLENKPCYDIKTIEEVIEFTFDGNLDNAEVAYNNSVRIVRISEEPITLDDFMNATFTVQGNGYQESYLVSQHGNDADSSIQFIENETGSAYFMERDYDDIVDLAVVYDDGFVYGEHRTEPLSKGIWVMYYSPSAYYCRFEYPIYSHDIKQLDEKFIPDTIARVKDLEDISNYNVSFSNKLSFSSSALSTVLNNRISNTKTVDTTKLPNINIDNIYKFRFTTTTGEFIDVPLKKTVDNSTQIKYAGYLYAGENNTLPVVVGMSKKAGYVTTTMSFSRPTETVNTSYLTHIIDTSVEIVVLEGVLENEISSYALSNDVEIKNSLSMNRSGNSIIGLNSTALGGYNVAQGNYSFAEGLYTIAKGIGSHAEGNFTIASNSYQHVQGKYNIEDTENKYAHIVGNGGTSARSNAHTLDWKGNAWYQGNVSIEGTPTNDNDLTTKKYVDDLVSNVDIDLSDYITDTELEEKGYITEIPSEYITNTELEGKGYITDTDLEEEMVFETDSLTVNSLGGISANTDLNGLTVKEILNKLLFPYIEPVITVTATPNGGTYEKGNNQAITNVSVSITKKSEIITKIEVLNGTQVIARQNDEAINNGGTFNYNVNVNVPSTNKQLTVKVTDNSGNAITKTTNSFTFVYPYYYGVCDEGTTINGDLIKSLTKSVTSKGTKTVTYTTNNQRMIFAYPKSYGTITKILDPNSFDVTSTFTMSQITIIGLDGTGQSYYVYVNSPSTVSNFNMKFSY